MVTRKTEGLRIDWSLDVDASRFEQITCTLDGYPGWRILPEIEATSRGLLLRKLVIEPAGPVTPDAGITTRMLREIHTGSLIAALRAATHQARHYAGSAPDLSVSTRVGRRGREDHYYAGWAAEYASALTRSGHPVAELAARHHLSASQVRNLMHACRRRGMLTAAPPGRAGGELTPVAVALLEAAAQSSPRAVIQRRIWSRTHVSSTSSPST